MSYTVVDVVALSLLTAPFLQLLPLPKVYTLQRICVDVHVGEACSSSFGDVTATVNYNEACTDTKTGVQLDISPLLHLHQITLCNRTASMGLGAPKR